MHDLKFQNHVSIDAFALTRKVLPKDMQLTVVTKNSFASFENIRCVPLEQ